jgi:hypothetical protein
MKQLEKWFSINNLMINTEKTKAVQFQERECGSVHTTTLFKNYITENLSWASFIQHFCQKVN